MADDDTTTQTAPPPAALPPGMTMDQINALAQQFMPQMPQRDMTPVNRSTLSLLGEALSGGPAAPGMTPAEQEMAGKRALMNFGTSMLAASGYQPGGSFGTRLAQGLRGAQSGEVGSEELAMAQLGAQQDWALKQQAAHLEALKTALPFLQLQATQGISNPLLGGNQPGAAPGGGISGNTYESAINTHEGSGKDPNSSAVGGFLSGTWNDFAAANPDLFKGMTPQQILAARSNSALRDQATSWLAQQNAKTLTDAGVTPSGQSLGISHYLGAAPAAKVMAAPDNTPVRGFVSDAAVKANPELGTLTAGQLKQRYANVPNPGFLVPPGGAPLPKPVQVAGPGAPAYSATTTPPAAPAPQQTTQADQPPTPPQATTPPTGAPMTFEQFQAQHPITIDPSTYAVTPPNLADAIAAKNAAAQTLDMIHKHLSNADPNKATQAYTDASQNVAKLQQEAQSKSLELQQTAQKNALDTQRQLYADEMQRQQQDRLKQQELAQQAAEADKQRAAAIALKAQEGEQAIKLEQVKTDEGLRAESMKTMDAETKGAIDNVNNLQALRELSRAAGPATPLSDEARQWLVRWGMTSPSQASQYAAQSALDEANNRMIGTLRQGMGFQRTTDKDLAFLSANTPGGAQMPPEFRDARTAFLIDQANRTIQFNKLTRGYMQSGMNYPDAATKADGELKPIIQQAPAQSPTYDPTVPPQTNRDRYLWDNVADGSFYKDQNGNLKIMHKTDKNGNPYARP